MPKVPPLTSSPRPVVVGFSARALAEATAASMGHPIVLDRFADHDCQKAACASIKLRQWGGSLDSDWDVLSQLKAAGAQPSSPVLLGGGTENWPELVDLLHQHFTVLGPNEDQLLQLRSLEYWQACATAAGVAVPDTCWKGASAGDEWVFRTGVMREAAEGPAGHIGEWVFRTGVVREAAEGPAGHIGEWVFRTGVMREAAEGPAGHIGEGPAGHIDDWLFKPRRGAGGHAIRRATDYYPRCDAAGDTHYWQREIIGRSLGVYCILDSDCQVDLLGATESLAAAQWPGPSEFIYRGSVGPICLTDKQRQQIIQLCQVIQATSGCRGWLQLDFIEDAAGTLWLLELNPRWAAGMEILFLAGINPVAAHCRAWQRPTDLAITQSRMSTLSRTDTHFAKAVVYADRELTLTRERIERLHRLPRTSFADLPSHSTLSTEPATKIVSSGEPLLTVRASGPTQSLLEQMIQLRETALNVFE